MIQFVQNGSTYKFTNIKKDDTIFKIQSITENEEGSYQVVGTKYLPQKYCEIEELES